MKPTRLSTLALAVVVCAALTWLVLRSVYQRLPPLPWTGVPALLIAAVAEAWTGRDLKARIAARRGSGQGTRRSLKPVAPLFVARMVALAKATSLAAAIIAGIAAGFDIYLAGSLTASVPREDALTAVVTFASAVLLACAALYLEYCCRVPDDPDGDRTQRPARTSDPAFARHAGRDGRRAGVVPPYLGSPAAFALTQAPSSTAARTSISWSRHEPESGEQCGRRAPGPAHGRRHRRRAGGHRARRGPGPGRPPGGRGVRRVRRVAAPGPRELPGAVITEPGQVLGRPTWPCSPCPTTRCPAWSPGWPRPGRRWRAGCWCTPAAGTAPRCSSPRPCGGALPLALHPVMTFTGRPDDIDRLHRDQLRGDRAGPLRPAAEALVIEMGGEPVFIAEEHRDAVPRGAGERGQPPGHAGRPGHRPAPRGRGGRARPGCSRRCCPPPWTTRCGSATPA